MKKLLILLLFLFSSVFPAYAKADFKKTKVAVLDFQLQGEGFETKDMGKIVAEWVITGLVQAGRFDVIERGLLEKLLKEQELSMYGIVDAKSAAKTGKIVGAKVVITGSVMKLKQFTEVSTRLINVEDGSIIAAEKVKSESATRLEDLVSQMIEKIVLDFPLEGYIVNRGEDNTVTIDLGRTAGARIGKRFIVFKEGKIIKHPKTGEVLDIERIEIGEIEIKSVKDKTATGFIIKEASPKAIEYGRMVRSAQDGERAEIYTSAPVPVSSTITTAPAPAPQAERRPETAERFEAGQDYYALTTLHTAKRQAVWENRIDLEPLRAGSRVTITAIERHYVKFRYNGAEYIFTYHHSKVPNHDMLSKFFTMDNPASRVYGTPQDVKDSMDRGEVKPGMTKWQTLFAVGVPVVAGDKKTHNLSLDDVLRENKWIFSRGRFGKFVVEFADERVVSAN